MGMTCQHPVHANLDAPHTLASWQAFASSHIGMINPGFDWTRGSPYICTMLAGYAARGRLLDEQYWARTMD